MTKTFIFNGVIWNSLLIMFLCENNCHTRFIDFAYSEGAIPYSSLKHLRK